MNGNFFKHAMCVILALMMFGCRSAYDLTLYSQPSGVIVEVGPDMQGRTPCNLKIPRKSELIQDHHIDVKYILDDGQTFVRSYDLRKYEPPGADIGSFIGGCIAAPGILLLMLIGSNDKDDEKEQYIYKPYNKEEEEKERKERKENAKTGWAGAGLFITGGLIVYIFGNHNDKRQYSYDIREIFEEANSVPNK